MNFEDIKSYCLSKPGAVETYPFDEVTLVFKVCGKMFGLTSELYDPVSINLKADPEYSEALRSMHKSITPGYHMNKRHWITVKIDGSIPDDLILELIDDSYQLVINKLPKSQRDALTALH